MMRLMDVPMTMAKNVPHNDITLKGIDMSGTGGMIKSAFEYNVKGCCVFDIQNDNDVDDDKQGVVNVTYDGETSKPRLGSAGNCSKGKNRGL
mmetsp:Transcript_16395/g.18691  ORF Transcript_16395/g.18691 Transcript_16395/m.18691 type:complete len:92 (+) Transcript_16395:209-484(+)